MLNYFVSIQVRKILLVLLPARPVESRLYGCFPCKHFPLVLNQRVNS
jgi:hypothetical protein